MNKISELMTSRRRTLANYLFWILMILCVAVPSAVRFYGNRIPSFLDWLPVSLISAWGFPISLIALGFILG